MCINYVTDAKMSHFVRGKYVGYFDTGDVIDTRDLSLSQSFLAILVTIAYLLFLESSVSIISYRECFQIRKLGR